MRHEVAAAGAWRPVAYIAVDDLACRACVKDTLQGLGWTVIEQPSAFHILSALADAIEKDASLVHVGTIVVDEHSRGCSGTTLARGLRELGCTIPIVIVRDPRVPRQRRPYGTAVHVVEHDRAPAAIAELVRPWSPIALTQPTPARARAMA